MYRRDQGYRYILRYYAGEDIDDFWNVDGDRALSDMWTDYTRFTLLTKTTGWISMVWGQTRKQTTSRRETLWPEIWKGVSDASKRKEKQKWAVEKPKLDKTTLLRGIFLHLRMKNVRRKLEVLMPAAMPCKLQREKHRETCRVDECKTKHACTMPAKMITYRFIFPWWPIFELGNDYQTVFFLQRLFE